MQQKAATVVVLATGGTIAGTAASASEHLDYESAQLGVESLLGPVAKPDCVALEAEQVAQVDSKDMTFAIWRDLARRIAHHLARPDVAGVVVTHGTDTMEETAWFLARVVACERPVVLTGAMRPATANGADGPGNLADALRVAAAVCRPASWWRWPATCTRHATSTRRIRGACGRSAPASREWWRASSTAVSS